MERNAIALHYPSILLKNKGFFTAKSLAQYHFGFARGKNIQNNAVSVNHSKNSITTNTAITRFPTYQYHYIK